ncbi:CHAT domain-containing protein [Nostoc sp. PCC 7107]|uniref:CHAT domain-containing protein n=1 Tax=Nostoc sp. PCC 7107 TaxID=317936 RepID=UPI00029F133E|nr:CHAT domain-containing protein [Nostoc sp. PCC 7107]AFY44290.1 Tetratricopeptide TPR_1 repeat-containing protein [Nostoc sp. PCC 7107]
MSAILFLATLSQINHPVALIPNSYQIAIQNITAPIANTLLSRSPQQILEQGIQIYQSEEFTEAARLFQQAAGSFQAQGDHLNQSLALNYLALAHQQVGQLPQAQKAITDSLALLKIARQRDAHEYLSILAQALNTQGQIQLASGHSQEALTSWEQATAIYSKMGDDAGKIGSQLNQTQALQALGLYRRAKITLIQVNQILQKQPASPLKVTGLLNLGNTLRLVGDLSQEDITVKDIDKLGSVQVLEQSLSIAEQVYPQLIPEIHLSLGNTAQALSLGKSPEEKSRRITQALDYYQKAAVTKSPLTRVQAQLNQIHLFIAQQKWHQVQSLWPEIQQQLNAAPTSRKTIYARINFAQSLTCFKQLTEPSRMGINASCPKNELVADASLSNIKSLDGANVEWKAIAQIIATAVDQAKTLKDMRAEAYALGTLGNLYEQTHQWTEAQQLTQQALKLAEGIGATDIAYRWHWQLGRILKAQDNPQRNEQGAIASYTKAVNILKLLRSDLVAINREVQFSFQEGVEPVYRELVSLLLQNSPYQDNSEASQKNLKTARDVIESLQLAELDNFFRKACLDAKPVQIDEIDRTAAVIYPIILSDRLEVIVSLPNKLKSQKQNLLLRPKPVLVSQTEVEKTIQELRAKLVTRSTREFLPVSQKVYNWLIRDIEPQLQAYKVQNLVFVLDGTLRSVPMAALHDGKQYLIEKGYNIALTPGLHLLPNRSLTRQKPRTIAAGITEALGTFEGLPSVKNEINSIQQEVPTRTLLDSQFTKIALEKAIKSFSAPVVHLATHGQFASNAEDTYILTWKDSDEKDPALSSDRVNVNELSSILQSRETSQRNAIELLVLSACQTASGDKRAGLGIAGFALRSGARSTLATLWSVDDQATATIMGEFYKQFANTKESKAEALKRAQMFLLTDPNYKHPYYWAPYVLVGNWL